MPGYYRHKLAGERLRQCYALAPPRVQQYLQAEIDFVLQHVAPTDRVMELGCGYGRVLAHLLDRAAAIVGIDTSRESLDLADELVGDAPHCALLDMNALELAFPDGHFDLLFCIQNGIAAFHVDHAALVAEAVRVTKGGGTVLFSTYAPSFWNERLEWFRLQAAHALIGEIDEAATGNGVIVCKDRFTATTVSEDQLRALTATLGLDATFAEVDGSSLFCVIRAP